ncbi:MAG: class I SAM-dependent methyltransferase [Capsulimonadales bacterium]|nr:class I SAM-dependent methyltransferase [Capsulimonadales bacterium]
MATHYTTEIWDQRYGGEEFAYGTAPNDFLRENAHRIPTGRVLCLCEGEGRNGVFLAERGYSVVGVDGSAVGLAKAERLAAERSVTIETIVADLNEFEIPPAAWSGIVSIFAHLPHALRRRLHRQAVDGLMPGGVFLLEAYTPDQIGRGTGGPSVPELLPRWDDLRDELAGLEFLLAREIEREIHEGRLHGGNSAVVQVVARKPE